MSSLGPWYDTCVYKPKEVSRTHYTNPRMRLTQLAIPRWIPDRIDVWLSTLPETAAMGLDETMGETLDNVLSPPRRDKEPVIRFGGWDQWQMGHDSAPIDRHCARRLDSRVLIGTRCRTRVRRA